MLYTWAFLGALLLQMKICCMEYNVCCMGYTINVLHMCCFWSDVVDISKKSCHWCTFRCV